MGTIVLCVNTEILDEYEEIISQKIGSEIAKNVVEAIARLPYTCYQESYIHFELISADRDDNKFVDCAVAANAEYIVTNDNHFNILQKIEWPKIMVMKIKDFVDELLR